MKTVKEMIETMTAYDNGAEIESKHIDKNDWLLNRSPGWNWNRFNYRIKEPKKTITIEKWLMKTGNKESFFVTDGDESYFENYYASNEKIKLLETYEVEL